MAFGSITADHELGTPLTDVDPGAASRSAPQAANVTAAKPVQPTQDASEARERIREQVMAERGIDLFDLYKMGSQERTRAEAAIMTETALRSRRASDRKTGNLVDLRV